MPARDTLRKAWIMARTEIRMVFKSRQVKSIPIVIFVMSIFFAFLFGWLMLLFGTPDPAIFSMFMSYGMGTTVVAMPVMLPVMIAADSIVGEKERNTLIPLLATPLTDTELLFGKLLTALVPGVIVAYANLIVSIIVVNVLVLHMAPSLLWSWPTPLAILQGLIFPPLFSALAVSIMIIISGRVSKVYEAYQTGGVIILPAMLFVFSAFIPSITLNWVIFIVGTVALLIADYALFHLARTLFNRDKLVTRI